MNTHLRVLFVEDSESDVMLVLHLLEKAGFTVEWKRVDERAHMEAAMTEGNWDIILCDFNMPKFSAGEALSLVKEDKTEIPFIIVSGSIGEDIAVKAMKAGAHDYVMKDKPARLVPAILRELEDAKIRRARAAAEAQLKSSERLRALGEAAASVLHDLKNPLQVISSCTELLQSIELPPDEHAKYLRIIGEQVERMVEITHEVLDFAKGQMRLSPEEIDLSSLLLSVTNNFRVLSEQKRISLQFAERTLEQASPMFNIDRTKLVRGVVNLLDNACSATPIGGAIKVFLTIGTADATISVEDTGPGISNAVLEKVFDPFVSHGKSHGTGLGLCITKNIVERHGGKIAVESYHGAGTRFTITLPRSCSEVAPRGVTFEQLAGEVR